MSESEASEEDVEAGKQLEALLEDDDVKKFLSANLDDLAKSDDESSQVEHESEEH